MMLTALLLAALAVTQGSATAPVINTDHAENNFLYNLLVTAGYDKQCMKNIINFCDPEQEGNNLLLQEMQEVEREVQHVETDLQQVAQNLTVELEKVKTELQAMKTEGKELVQQDVQEVKTEVQQVKTDLQQEINGMMQLIGLLAHKMQALPRHCKDLFDLGDSQSGIRLVYPYSGRPNQPETVFCQQEEDGGGWTVFQRRINVTVRLNFYRTWSEYQAGFGDLNTEFWSGLDLLHELSKYPQELRVELMDYDGGHRFAKYGTFQVASEDTNYTLTIGKYSGDAGDSLAGHNGQQFSTHDADHDKSSSNCAVSRRGAWWYHACDYSNLNGYQYVGNSSSSSYKGIVWDGWRGASYSLMGTTMMIRPAI